MNPKHLRLGLLVVCSGLLAGGLVYAQTGGGYDLSWNTLDGGGTTSSGDYTLSGAVGQPEAGQLSGGGYTLSGGFWSGGPPASLSVYLPLIQKP